MLEDLGPWAPRSLWKLQGSSDAGFHFKVSGLFFFVGPFWLPQLPKVKFRGSVEKTKYKPK